MYIVQQRVCGSASLHPYRYRDIAYTRTLGAIARSARSSAPNGRRLSRQLGGRSLRFATTPNCRISEMPVGNPAGLPPATSDHAPPIM